MISSIAVFTLGFIFGFLQSLLTGICSGRWHSGSGIVWGLAVGIIGIALSIWIGWYAIIGEFMIAMLIGIVSTLFIFIDKRRS